MAETDFMDLKASWNKVLDDLLSINRIAWLAFFDARLVELKDKTLVLSFADSQKLSGDHDFSLARNPKHLTELKTSIFKVTGIVLEIEER
ncbi:MAG: hypothetical protein WCK62_01905 [Actinomycetes bacterium]